jgi:hypothetical protein
MQSIEREDDDRYGPTLFFGHGRMTARCHHTKRLSGHDDLMETGWPAGEPWVPRCCNANKHIAYL